MDDRAKLRQVQAAIERLSPLLKVGAAPVLVPLLALVGSLLDRIEALERAR